MRKKQPIIIKAQRGITYECYRGFTDQSDSRVRRGQRYALQCDYRDFYSVICVSGQGYSKMIRKEKFASHFIPLNPLGYGDE
jgi:hypothetical protein